VLQDNEAKDLGGIGGGGGISNANGGTVTIRNTAIIRGRADAWGGGILNRDGGRLELNACGVSGNSANSGGGVSNREDCSIEVIGSTIDRNIADSGGGGISNLGTATVTYSTLSDNQSNGRGGGIANSGDGTVTVVNSTLSSNRAHSGEGGGGIHNFGAGTVTIRDSDLVGNSAHSEDPGSLSAGGSIRNEYGTVTIDNSEFRVNSADYGGGIHNSFIGTVTITETLFSGNVATAHGGGIYNDGQGTVTLRHSTLAGNQAASGGAILNWENGTLVIASSTLVANRATVDGGGIDNCGEGEVTITNSTLSSNTAAAKGGGIVNFDSGTVTILNATLADNGASSGGSIRNEGAAVTMGNSIFAHSPAGGSCSGAMTTLGYNLDSGNSCSLNGPGDRSNTDPRLGLLQDNGGPTETHALLPGSLAMNGVTDAGKCTVDSDQRGVGRPQGPRCDMGAYEAELVNDKISLASTTTCYNPTSVPNAPAGVYTISATFSNVSSSTLRDLFFQVVTLTGGNVVLNAEGGPGGEGAAVAVPPESLGADGTLEPGESFVVHFEIGLASLQSFSFYVDAYGVAADGVHSQALSYSTHSGRFEFEVAERQLRIERDYRFYIPIVIR
jgi:predicted outer membrane repeat protein